MIGLSSFFFAFRLAWRQLIFEKGKFFAAILGVMFACILVFMQLGFRDSLYASMTLIPQDLKGDLFVQHKQTEALWRTVEFQRSELMRAYASPDVIDVAPLYLSFATWRNPETFIKRTIMFYGYAPETEVFNNPLVIKFKNQLNQKDTIIFDRLSRPEFGPIETLFDKNGPFSIEANNYKLTILGTFLLGTSFSTDGNVITSDQNFIRIFPNRNLDQVNLGIIRLKPGSDIQATKKKLQNLLSNDVNVFDRSDIISFEKYYWTTMVPIGFVFGFGVIMGLIVGMVIVYQILYTDIVNHIREFATMKAMGYRHFYLVLVVFASSTILAVIGFIPGFFISKFLYAYSENQIYIEMPMPTSKIILVFLATLGMCTISGIIAIRKLRQASPAEMF